jgi:hypothetical protein
MMSSTLISNFRALAAAAALTCTGPSADNHAFQARERAIANNSRTWHFSPGSAPYSAKVSTN